MRLQCNRKGLASTNWQSILKHDSFCSAPYKIPATATAASVAAAGCFLQAGCVYEYRQLLEAMPHLLRISRKLVVPSKENRKNITAGEMVGWWQCIMCDVSCGSASAWVADTPLLVYSWWQCSRPGALVV